MPDTKQRSNFWFVLWSLIGFTVIFALWATSGWLVYQYYPEPDAHGTFGDMFGAVNALFSGWAFLGVIIAIILQKQELEEQRREIRESRLAQQQSADALRKSFRVAEFTAHVDALNHIITGYDRRISRVADHQSLDDKNNHERLIQEREELEQRLQKRIESYFDNLGE